MSGFTRVLLNRKAAVAIVLCLCAVQLFAGGGRWLEKYRLPVERMLTEALDDRIDLADNYLKVAGRYLSGKSVDDLNAAISQAEAANTAAKRVAANARLTAAYTAVYNDLANVDMGGDAKYRRSIYVDLESLNGEIRNAGYNEAAAAYNAKLRGFPAGLIKAAGLAKAMPLYE